ncbi:MAG: hypothetical protein IKT58_01740 [Oscillospiraceae bacterium]|nr:hypothetical protein [Oscillospiraceae bacterium]
MKETRYFLNIALAAVLSVALLGELLLRYFAPAVVLPELNIPNMVALSMLALLLEFYMAPKGKDCYMCIVIFSALSFGFLPVASGYCALARCWKFAAVGAVVFTACTWVFRSMTDRLSTGPVAKAAPIISAFGIYLASQGFQGMIL